MALLRPDGTPLNGAQIAANVPQTLGFIILRQDAGRVVPLSNEASALVIFASPEAAAHTAKALADQELRPSAEQKVVTPQMTSHKYIICALGQIGEVQAKIKNPEALLAGNPAEVN